MYMTEDKKNVGLDELSNLDIARIGIAGDVCRVIHARCATEAAKGLHDSFLGGRQKYVHPKLSFSGRLGFTICQNFLAYKILTSTV